MRAGVQPRTSVASRLFKPAQGLRRYIAIVLAVMFVASACGGGTSNGGAKGLRDPGSAQDGTLVFGAEQEPVTMNSLTTSGCTTWTMTIVNTALSSLLIFTPDFGIAPQLLSELPEMVSDSPQRVRYKIRQEAVWDDGSPLNADDVQFTLAQIIDPNNEISDRTGYDQIKDGSVSDVSADKKEFTLEFAEPYSAWKTIFASIPVMKKAAFVGKDFNTALTDELPFSSGPFKFESWDKKSSLTLVRNDKYWGKTPQIDKFVFTFILETNAEVRQLQGDEVQVLHPQPQTDTLGELRRVSDIEPPQVEPGLNWEHLAFNTTNPHLASKDVRQALSYMIDRNLIVERVAKPSNPKATVLQNVFYVPTRPQYQPGFDMYRQNYAKSAELLQTAGYTKGSDGIWQKDGKKLELKVSTTAGNKMRELVESMLAEQFAKGGVRLTTDNAPGSQLFTRAASCDYDISLFAHTPPPDPFNMNNVFSGEKATCGPNKSQGGGMNFTAYNNPRVTALLNQANSEFDAKKRSDIYNDVNRILAEDVPVMPIYLQSEILAFNKRVHGPTLNTAAQGAVTWNVQDWYIQQD